MKTVLQRGLLCGMLLVCGVDASPGSDDRYTAEAITVQTASGRRFRGQVDPATDSDHLRLRSTRGTSSVLRPIRWQHVVQVELGGETYSGEEFLAAFQSIRSTLPPPPTPLPSGTIRLVGSEERPRPVAPATYRSPLVSESASAARVRWLRVDAQVANWDSDAEVDGLLVDVQPRDDRGLPAPADGVLSVCLYGHRNSPVNRPEPPILLGSWSQRIASEEFGPNGAVYRFPFQAADPALNLEFAPKGLVRASFSVSGQGVFEANDCLLRLRPYCSVRDEMFRATGR